MLRHKRIDRICCIILAYTLLLTCLYMGAAAGGLLEGAKAMGYENRLFDQSRVHTIDIVMDDWEGFLEHCTDEEYASCSVVIDGEAYANVGIRAKGNTSLSSVASYGNNRYSFKLEFDQYQIGRTYYGLDKISLNNLIQDKTLMKDYLAYTLMNKMGAAAPLCSFVQISVNGEAWGLYLAVEAVEDGFLQRNYGNDHGELYKPDSLSMGGGRGNGRDFDMDAFSEQFAERIEQFSQTGEVDPSAFPFAAFSEDGFPFSALPSDMPSYGMPFDFPAGTPSSSQPSAPSDGSAAFPSAAADASKAEGTFRTDAASNRTIRGGRGSSVEGDITPSETPSGTAQRGFSRGNMGGMGSSDVKLQYIDDNPASYSNIFSSAKTDIIEADQMRLIESLKKLSSGENIESAVDAEAVIRYLVVHNFMCNGDSYTGNMIHNYYLYEKDGQLSMLPWDYNLAFGTFNMGGSGDASSVVNSPIDSPVSSDDLSDRPMVAWIFESEEYTSLYHEIYAEFISLVYDSGWLDAEIARVGEMIAPYVQQDPTAFFTYEQFTSAIKALREFCSLRCASIDGQLKGVVPSTDEAQRTASASLIDASHVDLSDMGEFGMGGGRGGNNRGEMSFFSNKFSTGGAAFPGGITSPEKSDRTEAFPNPQTSNPDSFAAGGMTTASSANPAFYLIFCTTALAAALIIVRFAKSGR